MPKHLACNIPPKSQVLKFELSSKVNRVHVKRSNPK